MELVSRCVECGLAEPESLASLGGSAPGVVDGILSHPLDEEDNLSKDQTELDDLELPELETQVPILHLAERVFIPPSDYIQKCHVA